MNKCSCYFTEERYEIYYPSNRHQLVTVGRCNGTRERDVCSCNGDETKCDFYSQVKEKALKEQENNKICSLCKNDEKFKINSISTMNCTSRYATFDLGRMENIKFCPECGRKFVD